MAQQSEYPAQSNSSWRVMHKLEGREWWLWAFATAVTLVLTCGIVSLAWRGAEPSTNTIYYQTLREWVRGLAALVLLFDVYTTHQHLQLQRMRRRLTEREQLFHVITESAADMIAVVDRNGKPLYYSPSYQKILGYTLTDFEEISSLSHVHPDDREVVLNAVERTCTRGESNCLEYRVRHKDGTWRVLESRSSLLQSSSSPTEQLVIVSRDITERKRAEVLLEHRALHDDLTDLPNRALFLDRLQRAIEVARRHQDFKFAVFFIDIDGFKVFNDSLGYLVGDELLIQIARRLISSLRRTDTVSHRASSPANFGDRDDTLARPGGDEFLVLAAELHHASDAIRMADRLQSRLALPFAVNGQEITISASMGVVFNVSAMSNAEDVLRDAEIAMYRAKGAGKGRCEVFDPTMQVDAVRRLQLETELRRGAEAGEFRVYYQPVVSLQTLQIVGLEALSRWQRTGYTIQPAEFIAVAEETGIILTINRQLLFEACQQVRRWQTICPSNLALSLSVNVTSRQFAQPDLPVQIAEVLQRTNVKPHDLDLEITEEVAMSDGDRADTSLQQLKALGVSVSIDDFGTGYSCLERLHRFPVDRLKIDRTFISRMELDQESYEIVRVIILLAHNLGLEVVAEGIENRRQLEMLTDLACDFGQGYFFSPPADAEVIGQLLERAAAGETAWKAEAWKFPTSTCNVGTRNTML